MSTSADGGNNLLSQLPIQKDITLVRVLTPEDLGPFAGYRADPVLARYQDWEPMSRAEALAYLEKASGVAHFEDGRWIQLGIVDADTGKLIGDLGACLSLAHGQVEIGFTLSQAGQGKGHARRAVEILSALAFSNTGVDTIKAVTDTRNHASIRLLEACGFAKIDEVDAVFKGERCRESIYSLMTS